MSARVAMMAKSPSVSRTAVMTAQGMTQGITQAGDVDHQMPLQNSHKNGQEKRKQTMFFLNRRSPLQSSMHGDAKLAYSTQASP